LLINRGKEEYFGKTRNREGVAVRVVAAEFVLVLLHAEELPRSPRNQRAVGFQHDPRDALRLEVVEGFRELPRSLARA